MNEVDEMKEVDETRTGPAVTGHNLARPTPDLIPNRDEGAVRNLLSAPPPNSLDIPPQTRDHISSSISSLTIE
jgi:hypothetical protein